MERPPVKIVASTALRRNGCDPETGIRDLTIPRTLLNNFDHTDCGVYAEVIAAGGIAPAMRWCPRANKTAPRSIERDAAHKAAVIETRSAARQNVGADAARRVHPLGDRAIVVAGNDDRIAVRINTTDHTDVTAATTAHDSDRANLAR